MGRRQFLKRAAGAVIAGAGGEATAETLPPSVSDESDWPRDPAHEALVADAGRAVAKAVTPASQDRLRPGYHFLPPARFMNDPNGCVWHRGAFHMFYQHLPYWGEPDAPPTPGWGHALSRDLVHWEHQPIALMPVPGSYDAAAVASGCCVVADGRPTIVYTSVPPQAQSLARSFDGMRTWRRYARNPVIPGRPDLPGLEDGFRDPFVWREGEEWRMLVGSGIREKGGAVLLYRSADLRAWRFLGPLCMGMGPDCFQWECPNFFRLGDRWVLIVSPLLHSEPALRGPVQYAVGRYDGLRFEHDGWRPLDLGGPGCFYAPNSLADPKGRRILWGWLMGGGSPGTLWDGLLTLPRHLELGSDGRLRVWPVREVERLRAGLLADIGARPLPPGEALDVARGTQMDVLIEIEGGSTGLLKVQPFAPSSGEAADAVHFDCGTGELRHGRQAGVVEGGGRKARTLRFLLDRSVVEVYADRREAMSLRIHPPAGDETLRLACGAGEVQIRRLRAWRMASIG